MAHFSLYSETSLVCLGKASEYEFLQVLRCYVELNYDASNIDQY